jgi:putative ABC transport system permease protein
MTDLDAVVNRGFIKVLGLDENQAIGQKFSVTFIATGKLLNEDQDRIESIPVEYSIIGVTPDERTPLFYVPFVHLSSLGIHNYSQAKVVVNKEQNLAEVRENIESMGYSTTSVSDTVSQINSLFATLRMLLALVGMVALSVASLGMFNTLTVSLLERTREVGLLKAMGMKSYEVRDLFLAESMIMGSLGGILGITFGLLIGFILELILSAFSVVKGAGFLSIISIPLPFAATIIVLSFLVGILTGIYPARRAKKITALNALRYE